MSITLNIIIKLVGLEKNRFIYRSSKRPAPKVTVKSTEKLSKVRKQNPEDTTSLTHQTTAKSVMS